MASFIGIENLKTIADKFTPTIIMGASHFRPEVFDRLKINVESGVQYKSTKTVFLRKGHTTRQKVVGETVANRAGILVERPCFTTLAWNRYQDNKDNYRETAVVDAIDNTKVNYPLSELALFAAVTNYGEDLFDNLWHGDKSIKPDDPNKGYLSVMDGFITYLRHDQERGFISKAFGNYVELGASIETPANATDTAAYDLFEKFRLGWHQNLRNAPAVLVYLNDKTAADIARGYLNAHAGNATVIYQPNGDIKFPEHSNITLVPESSFGTGDLMIATTPNNFEYCVDSNDSRNSIEVQLGSDKDAMDITFQVQSIQGTRVVRIDAANFAISDGKIAPADVAGDYTKDVFIVTSNDDTLGTVTVNDAEPDNTAEYAAGTTLSLKATATEGEFVSWSDGVKEAERTIVTKGEPGGLTAIFKAKA